MFAIICTINEPEVREKALVLHLLMPAAPDHEGHCRLTNGAWEWQDYQARHGHRFVSRIHARRVIRRMIRLGEAKGARIYLAGLIAEEYYRDPVSGREIRLPAPQVDT